MNIEKLSDLIDDIKENELDMDISVDIFSALDEANIHIRKTGTTFSDIIHIPFVRNDTESDISSKIEEAVVRIRKMWQDSEDLKDHLNLNKPIEHDNVNHPSHYTSGEHECIDVMESMFGTDAIMDFCKCNIFKYRFRSNLKNGDEDIKKAEWYETKLMELQNKYKGKENTTNIIPCKYY